MISIDEKIAMFTKIEPIIRELADLYESDHIQTMSEGWAADQFEQLAKKAHKIMYE